MIPGWVLLLVSAGYVCLLFAVAYAGDQRAPVGSRLRPLVYALALAVYCSSWTFYGAVGTAAREGLAFLPIYLGPLLLMLFGWRMLERLVLISGEQRIVSIADFLSSRYGRAPGLAALVATVAVVAAVPYLALQFKAVAMSVDVLAPGHAEGMLGDPALYVAILLALFAILFGTRQIDATEHHRGMVLAVALESLVKLLAFIAIGVFAMLHLPGSGGVPARTLQAAAAVGAQGLPGSFVAQTMIAFAAVICLPRQFHVAVVECQDAGDIRSARWLFGGYLVLVSLFVLPITLAGTHLLAGDGVSPDAYVLALPLALDRESLALFAYIGGFSAATGMVIVSSVALSTMVSNDIVMPLLLRTGLLRHDDAIDRRVLWVRRATIVCIAMLAYAYHRGAIGSDSLARHGLLAFAAVAQFAPALIGGLYWRGASRIGAFAGLLVGASLWAYTLLLPELARGGWFGTGWIDAGPFGIGILRPHQLFGMQGWDALTHGVFWSLLINVGTFVFVSMRYRPRLQEQLLASPFLDPYAQRQPLGPGGGAWNVRAGELLALAERILGERHAQRAFAEYAQQQSGRTLAKDAPADRALLQFTERLLASAIGAASARLTLTSALRGSGMELGEVVALLDEASQELRFNREVLSSTLENISQGVSVVDAQMRLVAWNRRYQQLFDYPDGMLYVGRPVADLLRWNAERGEMGPGDIEAQVERRLEHLRVGTAHVFERVRANGQVIELSGRALPGGGYVTSYSDITDYKRAERELREVNETLEQRVEQRTREAESAQQSKTRFLAAISHDVLQPMNAARLFASAMRESSDPAEQAQLAGRVDASLRAAEELLDGLLDVSRLDAGVLQPQLQDFDAAELLRELAAQYAPTAAQRGLALRVHAPRAMPVRSDRRLLRRALQNFIGNAMRYTQAGGVLLAGRPRGDGIALEVWDTGPGIPPAHLGQIFDEFHRFDQPGERGARGLGLGLSICQRISHVLAHPLGVRSQVGRGSVFAIRVPRAHALPEPLQEREPPRAPDDALHGLRVLCLDNDREILAGMQALLSRWGVQATLANTVDEALAAMAVSSPQVLLVDYHLHDRLDGLDALDALRAAAGHDLAGALLTGDGSDALKLAARERGYRVLTKPVRPASLRAFLAAQPR